MTLAIVTTESPLTTTSLYSPAMAVLRLMSCSVVLFSRSLICTCRELTSSSPSRVQMISGLGFPMKFTSSLAVSVSPTSMSIRCLVISGGHSTASRPFSTLLHQAGRSGSSSAAGSWPIRDEYGGHVTRSPPITGHLAGGELAQPRLHDGRPVLVAHPHAHLPEVVRVNLAMVKLAIRSAEALPIVHCVAQRAYKM